MTLWRLPNAPGSCQLRAGDAVSGRSILQRAVARAE